MEALPTFELSIRPWFGPTKRAQELLSTSRKMVKDPASALADLVALMGSHAAALQHVRFIDFRHQARGGFRFTIALSWTRCDPVARQALYDIAHDVVATCGWYPLPQGERIASRRALASLKTKLRRRAMPQFGLGGDLRHISSAAPADGGCAIRVHTSKGSALLDTGLPSALQGGARDQLALLTHVHNDHAGGLRSGAVRDVPVLMSEPTAHSVLAAGVLDETELTRRAVIVRPGQILRAGPGLSVEVFPVPHCPGASGFVVRDRRSTLIYPGDICLATARHDFSATLRNMVMSDPGERKTLLLDATMAGREGGGSQTDAAGALLAEAQGATDIVLCPHDASQLLYAHLDLFSRVKESPTTRHGVSFILSNKVRFLVQLLHAAFINRELDQVDPFLVAQYGTSMSAWAESRWVYWLEEMMSTPSETPRVWLVTPGTSGDSRSGLTPLAHGSGAAAATTASALFENSHWTPRLGPNTALRQHFHARLANSRSTLR
jgi:glyoxylase-like metal-dependent hydrolase (beta-lactamase superfamily II)